MRDIDERGIRMVMEEAIKRATSGTEGIHVSFDLDGMDPDFAPGWGRPRPAGPLSEKPTWSWRCWPIPRGSSRPLGEVNPILDQSNRTVHLRVGLLSSLLGKKIL
jgi:arginase